MVAARGALAQLCVLRDGEVILDEAYGVEHDTPFLLFSAGKPLLAMLVHRLAERGAFALDDPLARYWPEFAANGKEAITIRHVLRHRSGLPYVSSVQRDVLRATQWDRSVRALARARPHTPPGKVPAYHVVSHGFLLGELVRRVTGRPLPEMLRAEVLEPAGMNRTVLGPPGSRVLLRGGYRLAEAVFNLRSVRDAVIPAATVCGTARDLARFYQSMLDEGDRWQQVTVPISEGEVDGVSGMPIRWSEGFQLGGLPDDPRHARSMGRRSDPLTFGHNGSNACVGWADPRRRLVFAYVTNRLDGSPGSSPHQCAVSDAVLDAADAAQVLS
jgi:CubicO group peptidase (beta-lactamase class C family)